MIPLLRAHQSRAMMALIALLFTACQTAPLSATREIAEVTPDPKLLELVKKDAIEAMGLYIHHLVLGQVVARQRLARKLGNPQYETYNVSSVVAGLVAIPLTGAIVSLSSASSTTTNDWQQARVSGVSGAIMATLIAGTITFTSDQYGQGSSLSTDPNSNLASMADKRNNPLAFIYQSVRPGKIRQLEEARSDHKNAVHQAKFVTWLKETAAEATKRVTLLFRLNPMESVQFGIKFEERLLSAFHAQKAWKPEDVIQVDIAGILRDLVPDTDDRLIALSQITSAASAQSLQTPQSNADLLKWLEASEREFRDLEIATAQAYREAHDAEGPQLKSILQQYQMLSEDIESFVAKLNNHSKIVSAKARK